MKQTTNYGLNKIELTDSPPDITVISDNMDIIDAALTPTADPAQVPNGLVGKISQWVSWITNRIKAITGKANWYDAPATTLEAANTHANATSAHSATSAATASRLMIRDASGRAKVAAPAAADDIARKDTVDALAGVGNTKTVKQLDDEAAAHLVDNATDHDIIRLAKSSTGTANALVIDTAGTFDLTKNGNVLHLLPNLTNTGVVTVAVDGQAAKSVKEFNVDTDTFIDLVAGKLKKNTPAQLVWSVANGFFILRPSGAGGSNIKSIQRGSVVTAGSLSSHTVTITGVDMTKSVVRIIGGAQADLYYGDLSIDFVSATQIIVERAAADVNAMRFTWEVIEFNNVKSKQKGEKYLESTSVQNVAITAVDTLKSLVFFSWKTYSTGQQAYANYLSCKLSSSTNLEVASFNNSWPKSVKWQVIEFN